MQARISMVADARTVALMGDLMVDLAACDDAHLMRKALAFAKVVVDAGRGSDGVVTLRGQDNPLGVDVALRA